MPKKSWIGFLSSFIVAMGYGIIIPVQSLYIDSIGISKFQYGIILSTFALSQMISTPLLGKISDNRGRAKFIAFSLLLFAISDLIFFLADGYFILIFARIIGGISAGMLIPALNGYITDSTNEDVRGKAMMYSGTAFSLGIIFGPVIGGFAGEINYRLPFLLVSVMGLINFIIAWIFIHDVREYLPQKNSNSSMLSIFTQTGSDIKKFWKTNLRKIFIVSFVIGLGFYSLEPLISFLMSEKFAATPAVIGWVFMLMGIMEALYQFFLGEKLISKFGEYRLLLWCVIALGLGYIMTMITPSPSLYILTIPVLAFSVLAMGASSSYLSKIDEKNVGSLTGVNSFFMSLGGVIGPVLCLTLFSIAIPLPYIFIFILCMVTSIYLIIAKNIKN